MSDWLDAAFLERLERILLGHPGAADQLLLQTACVALIRGCRHPAVPVGAIIQFALWRGYLAEGFCPAARCPHGPARTAARKRLPE